jgi:hypothetical protein
MTEVNAMSDLCLKAQEEAHGEFRCPYCLAYQQTGEDCRDLTGRLSQSIADKDWEQVRLLMDRYAERLRALQLPNDRPVH